MSCFRRGVMIQSGALVDAFRRIGFHWPNDIILAFLAGSHQHGARVEGKSDLDNAGVFIEPPHKVLGLDIEEHFTHNTSDNSRRNTADDEDYKLYSLRHWAKLAVKGNPSILSFLFTPSRIVDPGVNGVWNQKILPNRVAFLASSHAAAFIGYGRSQLHRMQGTRGQGAHGQRPELVVLHGYDVKAAMHMIRLAHECVELLRTGQITFPRPERSVLLEIRRGQWAQSQIEQEYLKLETQIHEAERVSVLPKRVDRERVSEILTEAYMEHWRTRGYLR